MMGLIGLITWIQPHSIQKEAVIQNKENSKRNELTEEAGTSPNNIELQSEDNLAPTLDIKKEMMANIDKTINSVASDQSKMPAPPTFSVDTFSKIKSNIKNAENDDIKKRKQQKALSNQRK